MFPSVARALLRRLVGQPMYGVQQRGDVERLITDGVSPFGEDTTNDLLQLSGVIL